MRQARGRRCYVHAQEAGLLFGGVRLEAQLVAVGVDGEEAPDPSTVGIKISARRATQDISDKEKSAAKKTAAKPQGTEKANPGSEELPIVVGEVADKRLLKRRLRLLQ